MGPPLSHDDKNATDAAPREHKQAVPLLRTWSAFLGATLAATAIMIWNPPTTKTAILIASYFTAATSLESCVTNTVRNSAPATGTGVALRSWSYCGGTLEATAYIENVNYDKIVTMYYTDANDEVRPWTAVQFGYQSGVAASPGWEYWSSSNSDVALDGITHLLNITFQALNIGQIYSQSLNIRVTPSGPPPTTSTIPKPYATPQGFSQDITDFLAPVSSSQAGISKTRMFGNIEVVGASPGTVIAAQSYQYPDYAYDWVRDSSLTMDVVQYLYAAATASTSKAKSSYENLFFRYAQARAQEQLDPNLQTGLGEPKFYLNNSVFTGPWGRPQNDGPATAVITLLDFAESYLSAGGSLSAVRNRIWDSFGHPRQAPVLRDLLYVADSWSSSSFDLWEEVESDHFYTRMVQRRALSMGADWAERLGDSETADRLSGVAGDVAATLPQFWNPIRQLVFYAYGPVQRSKSSFKDIAVVLGVLHGYGRDGDFSYTSDEILLTSLKIATSFLPIYPIATTKTDNDGNVLGIPVGRYPEDVYDGVGTSQGNPWNLCIAAMAELFYRASLEFRRSRSIRITNTSLPFWEYIAPQNDYRVGQVYVSGGKQFNIMISGLQGWGDAFIRTIKYHMPKGGHLSEEIQRTTGDQQGARDLTWSYGSLLTAAFARAEAIGETDYIQKLANLPLST